MTLRFHVRMLILAAALFSQAGLASRAFALPDVPCAVSSESPPTCTDGGAFCRLSNRPGQCQTKTLGCACVAAGAFPGLLHFVHDSCEPVGSHAIFRFLLLNSASVPVCEVHLVPLPMDPISPDSCQIYSCTAPSPWVCKGPTIVTGPRGVSFASDGPNACIPVGGQLGTFSVEMSLPGCCYSVVVRDDAGTYYDGGIVCFDCGPTPAKRQSWGRVKATYR